MNRTRCATLGLSLSALVSACSQGETTVSVNVRYQTDYLEPGSFRLKFEQQGHASRSEHLSPREVEDGKYEVVCEHDWEPDYCRFYKRFELSGWSEGDITVTFSGKTKDGKTIAEDVAERGIPDRLSEIMELKANEVNVVYFQLPNLDTPSEPAVPDPTSDAGDAGDASDAGDGMASDAHGDGGHVESSDAGASDAGVSASTTSNAAKDASAVEADADASD